jgi:uncharacterized phage-associated protein
MRNINQICDYIISRLKSDENVPLSNIKLQKLLYYVQAWHIAIKETPLFDGKFEAWVHGPVNRDIYARFNTSKYLYSEITYDDIIDKNVSNKLTEDEINHVNLVLDSYAKFSGIQLEEMSHNEIPWIEAREGYQPNERCTIEINESTLGDFFRARL